MFEVGCNIVHKWSVGEMTLILDWWHVLAIRTVNLRIVLSWHLQMWSIPEIRCYHCGLLLSGQHPGDRLWNCGTSWHHLIVLLLQSPCITKLILLLCWTSYNTLYNVKVYFLFFGAIQIKSGWIYWVKMCISSYYQSEVLRLLCSMRANQFYGQKSIMDSSIHVLGLNPVFKE